MGNVEIRNYYVGITYQDQTELGFASLNKDLLFRVSRQRKLDPYGAEFFLLFFSFCIRFFNKTDCEWLARP